MNLNKYFLLVRRLSSNGHAQTWKSLYINVMCSNDKTIQVALIVLRIFVGLPMVWDRIWFLSNELCVFNKNDDLIKLIDSTENVFWQKVKTRNYKKNNGTDWHWCHKGVCINCYRTAESIMKTESKNDVIKQRFREVAQNIVKTNMLQLPSPSRKSITKRMLRSPDVPSSKKQSLKFWHFVRKSGKIFTDLTNTCLPAELQKKEVIIILFMGFIIIFKWCIVYPKCELWR